MGTRGRKSKADLAVVTPVVTDRPAPPSCFTPEQKNEWLALVNALPAERFSDDLLTLLEAYCRHSVTMRHVGQLIEVAEGEDEFDVKDYDRLLKMQERESRCLASLAVRLGFAHTTGTHVSAKKKASLKTKDYSY